MIVGTDKKKEVTSLAFHGLERSMTFPILNCAVGRGGGKTNTWVNQHEKHVLHELESEKDNFELIC